MSEKPVFEPFFSSLRTFFFKNERITKEFAVSLKFCPNRKPNSRFFFGYLNAWLFKFFLYIWRQCLCLWLQKKNRCENVVAQKYSHFEAYRDSLHYSALFLNVKLLKSYFRSNTKEDRLSNLAVFTIHKNVETKVENVIERLAAENWRFILVLIRLLFHCEMIKGFVSAFINPFPSFENPSSASQYGKRKIKKNEERFFFAENIDISWSIRIEILLN